MIWLDIDLLMSYFNFRIWSPTPLLSFALYSTMVHILYILFGTVPQYPFQSQLVYILIQHVDYRSWLCARHSPRLRDSLIPSTLFGQPQPLSYSYCCVLRCCSTNRYYPPPTIPGSLTTEDGVGLEGKVVYLPLSNSAAEGALVSLLTRKQPGK